MKNFKELLVWQKSIDFVTIVYKVTDSFPDTENFGLKSQLRRASISIPSNISEGCARRSKTDFIQYLKIVRGSAAEVETQIIIISYNLKFINQEIYFELSELIVKISKMLNGLINSLVQSTEN
ncbi:four helix bundle protein [Elizabethkingia meningoseptica]|uniref:four helix bundle protein n=1 Tax=Elizabethkingia meningoseptica TaxID=238 RepID=UPI002011E4CF|nr:four helix bundle protein [Elizabethkingia meningoseptica]MCL1676631.1 four helix bundle protein [Elizabethkingia meningoseptica]MCL1686764.1 four helix bundle protein [Elizabethkingia meningoseptica]